jgi:hypothetical protein
LEDHILKFPGLYSLWTSLFIANLVALFVDDSEGPIRDFNILVNGLSTVYPAMASANTIYGNGKPSTTILIAGPIHQYLFWMLFAYFGGSEVLSQSELGVMNWISLFVVGGFSIDMFFKTWSLSIYPQKYLDYVKPENQVEPVD